MLGSSRKWSPRGGERFLVIFNEAELELPGSWVAEIFEVVTSNSEADSLCALWITGIP